MIKKFGFLLFLLSALFTINVSCATEEDEYDFENLADGEEEDVNDAGPVFLNENTDVVDVKQFDISGVMLGMSYDDINNLFFNNDGLYVPRKKNSIIYNINNEWRYNLDYECRQQNIFVPEQLEKCIYSLAKSRGLLYASEIHLEREQTGETIDIYLTSNATDNVVWKIVYTNDADEMEGTDTRFENQREKKLLSFWQGVLDKYGEPNSGEDKWISSDTAYTPMMQAYYGQLVLEDKGLNTTDSSENFQKARENFQAKPYAF
ncbi:MAG: hypothetical protein IKN73_04170 [Alphaproteobacteria bacterium]|nr:hypothetical protein [Alphaproteobacteria bacterium]